MKMIYRQYIMTDRPVVQCQYAEVSRKMVDEETESSENSSCFEAG